MKALRKQRLCSFLWGWGNGKIDLVLSKNGLGYLSQTVFSFSKGRTHAALLSIPGRFILARAVQHIPVTGGIAYVALLSIHGFHRTAPAV